MIKVEKMPKTLDEGIKNLMLVQNLTMKECQLETSERIDQSYSKEQVDNWDKKTRVKHKKVHQDCTRYCVFCFIAKEDFKHFKKGYIEVAVTMRLL